MVKRLIKIFNKEFININEAAFLLGIFALLSQFLGLFRDRALAHFLGASLTLDIYNAAFRIPDFIYVGIASLVSVTVLIPFLLEKISHQEDKKEGVKFLSDIFTVFLFLMVMVSVLAFIFLPKLSFIITPGFDLLAQEKLVLLSRIMLLSPILLGLSNLFGSITQIQKKFFVYALSPVFYNLGIIVGVMVFYPWWGISGLAVGVVLGALFHFLIQLPIVFKSGFLPKFSFKINWRQIGKVFAVSLPRTLALSFNNIALLAIISFASKMTEGSISIFNYSLHLQAVPLGVIGLSYSVAAFPTLAGHFNKGDIESFLKQIFIAFRQIIFWSMPIVVFFIVLRAQIVRIILGSGAFDWSATKLTAAALAIFSVSIIAQGLILLLVRGYYAAGNTRKPFWVNLFSSTLIIFLSIFLPYLFSTFHNFRFFIEKLLKVTDLRGTEVLMLALAYSFGVILNFLILWLMFRKDFIRKFSFIFSIKKTFWQSLVASLVIGIVSYYSLLFFAQFFDLNIFWGIFTQGLLSGLLGLGAGFLFLYFIKNEEILMVIQTFKRRFWKTKVIASGQEGMQ